MILRGRHDPLEQVPLLNIAGKKDHICTLPQAEATMKLVGSEDKEFFVLDAGHVGLMTGRGAKKGLWPKVSDWKGADWGRPHGLPQDRRPVEGHLLHGVIAQFF